MAPLLVGFQVASTIRGIQGAGQQGKDMEKIAEHRARVDRANADAAARRASAKAKMKLGEGRRLLASQKAQFAAGGVNVNMGSPLVVAAQTKADVLKDVGYILEGGEADRSRYEASAEMELAMGKTYRRRSRWDALTRGLRTGGDILHTGMTEWGWFDKENA